MKKLFCLLLSLLMALSAVSALALDFPENLKNEATFETFEEAEENALTYMAEAVYGNPDKVYVKHPALADYPAGTTYIYRSANLYGGGTAVPKLNTTVVVFAEEAFDGKDAAKAYLDKLGVIAGIDKMIGSIVLITPIAGEYGEADAAAFAALQTAFIAQQTSARTEEGSVYYPEGEYFGCYGEQYVIGVGAGAAFVHNCIASNADVAGTIAGVLLIGGDMAEDGAVATALPAYLVGASDATVEKYKAANEVTAQDGIRFYRESKPAQCVFVAESGKDAAEYVADAFACLFARVMRLSATSGTLPYSIVNRCAIIDGKTPQDVYVTFHDEDRFADITTVTGEYLDVWYEALPAEVLDGTAAPGSIPLILCLHGMGDDPLMFIYNQGLLELAGAERIALVSPFHQDVFWCLTDAGYVDGCEAVVMPALVKYMLETYPALDASRVYVTGYSMGGWATMKTLYGEPNLFAAVVPMSGMGHTPTEEQAAEVAKYDLPIMLTTSTKDLGVVFDATAGTIGSSHQTQLNVFLGYNDMAEIEYDFETYGMNGFAADYSFDRVLNEEYVNHTWYLNNEAGVPMVGLSVTEGLVHSLYPEFAKIMWSYAQHFSRDVETGAVIYDGLAEE